MNPGVHAAIAAAEAEKKRKMEEEEERMTKYNSDELEGEWEFKIVRSEFPVFRNPQRLAQVVQEESLSGWQMLEKLDDSRIRFKRHVSNRRRDEMLPKGVDAYRTQLGSARRPAIILGIVFVLFLLGIGGFVMLTVSGGTFLNGPMPWLLLTLILGILMVVGVAVFALKSR